jgi:hypothetical protein
MTQGGLEQAHLTAAACVRVDELPSHRALTWKTTCESRERRGVSRWVGLPNSRATHCLLGRNMRVHKQ